MPKFTMRARYAVGLALVMAAILGLLWNSVPQLERIVALDVKVPWENKQSTALRSGPSWFVYDEAEKVLKTSRPIDSNKKRELRDLADAAKPDATYVQALDKLAYASNQAIESVRITWWIIGLGGLCGILGVMSRSISSFVFHACFQKDLDLALWWPWYILRPFLGASVGITLIVLLKSKLLALDEPDQQVGFWILGLCILAGFGIDEFLNRVLYLSRTLFGESVGGTDKTTGNTSAPGAEKNPAKQPETKTG